MVVCPRSAFDRLNGGVRAQKRFVSALVFAHEPEAGARPINGEPNCEAS